MKGAVCGRARRSCLRGHRDSARHHGAGRRGRSGDASPGAPGDVREALRTIRARSQGLLDFVNAYRELTRVPKPELEFFALAGLGELTVRSEPDRETRSTLRF